MPRDGLHEGGERAAVSAQARAVKVAAAPAVSARRRARDGLPAQSERGAPRLEDRELADGRERGGEGC